MVRVLYHRVVEIRSKYAQSRRKKSPFLRTQYMEILIVSSYFIKIQIQFASMMLRLSSTSSSSAARPAQHGEQRQRYRVHAHHAENGDV